MQTRMTASAATGWRRLVPAAAFLLVFLGALPAGQAGASSSSVGKRGSSPEAEKLARQADDLELRKKYPEAEAAMVRANELWEKALGPNDKQVGYGYEYLGKLRYKQGKLAEAEAAFLKSEAVFAKIHGAEIDTHIDIHTQLCWLYRAQGRLAEARTLAEKTLAAWRSQLAAERHNPSVQNIVADAECTLADVCVSQMKLDEAEPLYRHALAVYQENRRVIPHGLAIVEAYFGLAQVNRFRGRFDEAESLYQTAIDYAVHNYGTYPPTFSAIHQSFGDLYRAQGKYAQAEPMYRRAIEILEKEFGPSHPSLIGMLEGLSQTYVAEGRQDEGQAPLQRSREIWNATFGQDAQTISESQGVIASLPGPVAGAPPRPPAVKPPSTGTTKKPPAVKPPSTGTTKKPPAVKPRRPPVAEPDPATESGGAGVALASRLIGSWRVTRQEGTEPSSLQEMLFRADGSVETVESGAQKKTLYFEVQGGSLALRRSPGGKYDSMSQVRFEGETLVLTYKKRNRTVYLERAEASATPPPEPPQATGASLEPVASPEPPEPPEPSSTPRPPEPATPAPEPPPVAAPPAPVVSDFPIEDAPAGEALAQAGFYYEQGLAHLKRACPGGDSPDPDKDARAALRYFDRAMPLFEKARAEHPDQAAALDEKIEETARLRYGSFKMQKVCVYG